MTDEKQDKALQAQLQELAALSAGVQVWRVPGVEAEPEIQLGPWQVRRVLAGAHPETFGDHFIGYNLRHSEGRVSTTIQHFDPTTGTGVTTSGRSYQLLGPPGRNADAAAVWRVWCKHAGVTEEIDVSDDYYARMHSRGEDA